MKKILLVNTNTLRAPYPVPPLGLCLLAASLEQRYEVRIYDGLGHEEEALRRTVQSFDPHFVGLGIRNIDEVIMDGGAYFIDAIDETFVKPLRQMTRAPLILGGSGFTLFAGELMEALQADFGVKGEGEETLPALLEALEGGKNPIDIPGVITRDGMGTAPRPVCGMDMDRLPFSRIDQHLDYTPYARSGAYPLQTKRGCAHLCAYCPYPALEGRSYRLRSPGQVVEELEEARARLGEVTFEIVDSTFNDPPGHAEGILREIIRRRLKVRLRTMGINPAQLTPRLLELMKEAGFAQIDCTPDTASPEILKSLKKNFTLNDLQRAALLIREFDMPTMWFFLLGGPGENETSLEKTFDFIDRFIPDEDMAHITEGLRIYPGCSLFDTAVKEGIIEVGEPILRPTFYVSPLLGKERLGQRVSHAIATRPNCIRASESKPPPALLEAALKLRHEQGLEEPMFRTLLRLKKEGHTG